MRPLVSIQSATKSFANVTVLRDIRCDIFEGDRIGLVGVNGSGKTTLCRLIMGRTSADTGDVNIKPDLRIGYLSQYQTGDADVTVGSELAESQLLSEMRREVEDINRRLEDPSFYDHPDYSAIMARYGELQTELVQFDGAGFSDRALDILDAFGCRELEPSQRLKDLSGGERQKVALARLIVSADSIDLMMLDEPTNHLDIDSMEWLEQYLQDYRGTVMVVSHDRYLLDDTCSRIFELEGTHLRTFTGDYTDYVEQKEFLQSMQKTHRRHVLAEVRRQEAFIEKMKVRNRFDAQIRSKLTRLSRIRAPPDPVFQSKAIAFKFQEEGGGIKDAIVAEGLGKRFGDVALFDGSDFTVEFGDKVGLVGPNGTGKTTLLRMIREEDGDYSGTLRVSKKVKSAYFDQGHLSLGVGNSLVAELQTARPSLHENDAKALLGRFNFKGEIIYNKVDTLSGGERARLSILKMVMSPANTLLLDEPTNHLDIQSRQALESALNSYNGTIIMATHDRYFLDAVATKIFTIRDGMLKMYQGGYSQYRDQQVREIENDSRLGRAVQMGVYVVRKGFTDWLAHVRYRAGQVVEVNSSNQDGLRCAVENGWMARR